MKLTKTVVKSTKPGQKDLKIINKLNDIQTKVVQSTKYYNVTQKLVEPAAIIDKI